jgi:hypothetical protein
VKARMVISISNRLTFPSSTILTEWRTIAGDERFP